MSDIEYFVTTTAPATSKPTTAATVAATSKPTTASTVVPTTAPTTSAAAAFVSTTAPTTPISLTVAPTTGVITNTAATVSPQKNTKSSEIDIIEIPNRHFNMYKHLSLRNIILILTIIAIILVLFF